MSMKIIAMLAMVVVLCSAVDMVDIPEELGAIGAKEIRSPHTHFALRRLDCQVFCKKTGFSGYVGGCQCGFTLFANKRSEDANGVVG